MKSRVIKFAQAGNANVLKVVEPISGVAPITV